MTVDRELSSKKVSETLFTAVLETVQDAIICVDEQQHILVFNQSAERIFGYRAEEVFGQPLNLLIPQPLQTVQTKQEEEFSHSVTGVHMTAVDQAKIYGQRKNGEEFSATASTSWAITDDHRIFTLVVRDTSQRQRVKQQLKQSKERFRLIVETLPAPLLITRVTDGTVLFANSAFAQWHGVDVTEVIGLKAEDLYYTPEERPILIKTLRQKAIDDAVEMHGRRLSDDSFIWFHLTIQPIKFQGESALLGVFLDLTERRRLEDELHSLNEQLEQRVVARTQELTLAKNQLEAEIAEREQAESALEALREERERHSLAEIARSSQTSVTARMYGSRSLSEIAPATFKELVYQFGVLLELALERRTYHIEHPISDHLRTLTEKMGSIRVSPRDVVEIYNATLRKKRRGLTSAKADAYIEEGRLMLLELMGYLVAYYRNYAFGTNDTVIPTDKREQR